MDNPVWIAFHIIAVLVLVAERLFAIALCLAVMCVIGFVLVVMRHRSGGGKLLSFAISVVAGICAITLAVSWLVSGPLI